MSSKFSIQTDYIYIHRQGEYDDYTRFCISFCIHRQSQKMHDMTTKRYNYIQICEHAFNVFIF